MDPADVLAEAIIESLSSRVDVKVLRKAFSNPVRKELYRRLAERMLYLLLSEGNLNLPAGFGSVQLKQIREKDKKMYNRATGQMFVKKVKGERVVYRPGEIVKQLM